MEDLTVEQELQKGALNPIDMFKLEIEHKYKNTEFEFEAYETSFLAVTLAKQFDDIIRQKEEGVPFDLLDT